MARKRITTKGNNIKNESPLRRLFEEHGKCAMAVRLHIQYMESKGINMTKVLS